MEKSDEMLVTECQTAPLGDTRAFDELTRRHQERVLANCRYLSGSADDAQDLAQGVFVKAYFGLRKFKGKSAFGAKKDSSSSSCGKPQMVCRSFSTTGR